MENRRKDILRAGKRLLLIIGAATLLAVNIKTFVRAGNLIPGGFTGITILLQKIALVYGGFALPFAPVNLLLNAIPVYISFRFIGKKFTIYSCIMILLSSILTDIMPVYPITYDVLLVSIFGGLVNGVVISMCLFADATSGGTDFLAIFASQKYGIDAWNYILIGNAALLLLAGYLFGWDKALYSIIFQFTSTEVLQTCYKRYKKNTLFIITDYPEEVAHVISVYTRHGATNFNGLGAHEKKSRTMVYSVVASDEVKKVVSKIKEIDPNVFINVIKTEQLEGEFYRRPND
ncbi:MAG: YitT family protein [Lachnospiraceae bacterium]